MTLEDQIKDLKFDYVHSNITPDNFPIQLARDDLKVFHFDEYITSDEAVMKMNAEGYEPANLYELLAYAKNDWNGKDLIAALGSVCVYLHGYRGVPYLGGWDAERGLYLYYWGGEWNPRYRFLATPANLALSPSDTQPSDPLESLRRRVEKLEALNDDPSPKEDPYYKFGGNIIAPVVIQKDGVYVNGVRVWNPDTPKEVCPLCKSECKGHKFYLK